MKFNSFHQLIATWCDEFVYFRFKYDEFLRIPNQPERNDETIRAQTALDSLSADTISDSDQKGEFQRTRLTLKELARISKHLKESHRIRDSNLVMLSVTRWRCIHSLQENARSNTRLKDTLKHESNWKWFMWITENATILPFSFLPNSLRTLTFNISLSFRKRELIFHILNGNKHIESFQVNDRRRSNEPRNNKNGKWT